MAENAKIMEFPAPARTGATRRGAKRSTVPSLVHAAQVTSLINLAARLTNKAARIRMGRIGAWPGQIPLLLWLLEEDGLIQKELVERSNMEQSTVAEHLDRMERDVLIYRKRGNDDRRKYRVYLTPKGRLASRNMVRLLETGAETFTKNIPSDKLAIFTTVIRQIISRLDDYVGAASGRSDRIPRRVARRAPVK